MPGSLGMATERMGLSRVTGYIWPIRGTALHLSTNIHSFRPVPVLALPLLFCRLAAG